MAVINDKSDHRFQNISQMSKSWIVKILNCHLWDQSWADIFMLSIGFFSLYEFGSWAWWEVKFFFIAIDGAWHWKQVLLQISELFLGGLKYLKSYIILQYNDDVKTNMGKTRIFIWQNLFQYHVKLSATQLKPIQGRNFHTRKKNYFIHF